MTRTAIPSCAKGVSCAPACCLIWLIAGGCDAGRIGVHAPTVDAAIPVGCGRDTDCKGSRICVSGNCVDPPDNSGLDGSVEPGGPHADLGATDLAAPIDFAAPIDMTIIPDLTLFADLSPSPDMAVAPGQARAVAYQIDIGHTGAQIDTVAPPLRKKWAVTLEGASSYPLIADGRVFVLVVNPNGPGVILHSLDSATGMDAWPSVVINGWAHLGGAAWDAGNLFVLADNGILYSYDAATGKRNWLSQLAGQSDFSSPPTASRGMVYSSGAGSGGTFYGVSQVNGATVWTASVENGDNSSPSVDATGVYASYACNQAYGYEPLMGHLLWHYSTNCEGGGGKTTAVSGGRVYTRDSQGDLVLDHQTGLLVDSFTSTTIPAFDPPITFYNAMGSLSAYDSNQARVLWQLKKDAGFTSAPIVVNGYVYAGTAAGNLYAIDERTGQVAWFDSVGAAIPAPDEQNGSQPLTGLAAGGGMVVVPAGRLVVAYY